MYLMGFWNKGFTQPVAASSRAQMCVATRVLLNGYGRLCMRTLAETAGLNTSCCSGRQVGVREES